MSTISEVCAAFGRGDIPSILDAMAEDVRWEHWDDHTAQRAPAAATGSSRTSTSTSPSPRACASRDEELHLWRFDVSGRICGMRHYVDTAKHLSAFEAGVADREERAPQYG